MSSMAVRQRKKSVCYVKPNAIYIQSYGKLEQIEISSQCTGDDIQDLLKSICGAGKRDTIKLTNNHNVALPLVPSSLIPNVPSQPYHVEVISCCPQLYTALLSQGSRKSLQNLDTRVQTLELKIRTLLHQVHETPSSQILALEDHINKLQNQIHSLHLSRHNVKPRGINTLRPRNCSEMSMRCSSCSYFKNFPHLLRYTQLCDLETLTNQITPSCNWYRISKTHEQIHRVWMQYQSIQMNEIKSSIRGSLKTPSFNMMCYNDSELLHLVKSMFVELQLTKTFSIPIDTLDHWLLAIYQNYNSVPFHNFTHAFCVIQMVYALIHITKLNEIFDDLEILTLLFAAICHDLDHPGLNNTFQINARTCLAQRYNDQSPLENHHCALAFQLLKDEEKNILKQLSEKQFKKLREISIKCILATDMVRHGEILSEFRRILPTLDIVRDPHHRVLLMVVIIKACDISNEVRPQHISESWLECLLEEFFQQSDLEKQRGMPFASFMDREKVTKSNSQCGFIKFVILPLYELLSEKFPPLEEHLLRPVKLQLEFYNSQQSKRTSIVNMSPSPRAAYIPIRKVSTGSIPSRKSSVGYAPRRQSLSIYDQFHGPIAYPARKTSTGSLPSRKSSSGSLVLAQS